MPGQWLRDRDDLFDVSQELSRLTRRALERMGELIEIPLDPDDRRSAMLVLEAGKAIINTAKSVSEESFRRKKLDVIPKLLEIISREEAKTLVIEGMLNAD